MKKKKKQDEVEVTQKKEQAREYYYLKVNKSSHLTRKVPQELFNKYADARNEYLYYHQRIKEYFQEVKDAPLYVAKNHVREDEVHHFNDDGSVTISKKGENERPAFHWDEKLDRAAREAGEAIKQEN